jgi:hypothetical protein
MNSTLAALDQGRGDEMDMPVFGLELVDIGSGPLGHGILDQRTGQCGAQPILAPDWRPLVWTEGERSKGGAGKTFETVRTHETPAVQNMEA